MESHDEGAIRVSLLLSADTAGRFRRVLERRRLKVGEPLADLSRHKLALHLFETGLRAEESAVAA